MRYHLAIFDFDGTLADSFPFLVSVYNDIADQHSLRRIDLAQVEQLRRFDVRQAMRYVGMPVWKLPLAAASFTSLMQQHAEQIPLFPHVAHALHQLSASGIALTIVSSNSEANVRKVLGPELSALISQYECGMSVFGKSARIRKVLRRAAVAPSAALYIGDQATDAEAARQADVDFAAVHWGYAPIDILRQVAPAHEFDLPSALAAIPSLYPARAGPA